jgi:hypothetical protein
LCEVKDLAEKELYWMDIFKSYSTGYNLRRDSLTGMITHPKTSKKISNRLKQEWASGLRKDHGRKLANSWKNDSFRKKMQSDLLSKTLTKYSYNLYNLDSKLIKTVFYQELVQLKLNNVLAKIAQKKSDKVEFKGYFIERIKVSKIKI